MLRERNKELALLMLRNLMSDIERDNFIVMDVSMDTSDPRVTDPYSYASGEQVMQVRVRLDEKKFRDIAEKATAAMEVAAKRHECKGGYVGQKKLTFDGQTADIFKFSCACGKLIEISGMEASV